MIPAAPPANPHPGSKVEDLESGHWMLLVKDINNQLGPRLGHCSTPIFVFAFYGGN